MDYTVNNCYDNEHRQMALDMQSSLRPSDIAKAVMRNADPANDDLYKETEERRKWAAFFQASSHLPDVSFVVTYLKKDGGMRTMWARLDKEGVPIKAQKYLTVVDIDRQEFRRLNLDAIVKVTLETGTCYNP